MIYIYIEIRKTYEMKIRCWMDESVIMLPYRTSLGGYMKLTANKRIRSTNLAVNLAVNLKMTSERTGKVPGLLHFLLQLSPF